MKTLKRTALLVITSFLLAVLVSCEADSSLFSESDRNSMYSVTVQRKDQDLADGSFLKLGENLDLSVKALAASEESLSSIEFSFEDPRLSNSMIETTEVLVIKAETDSDSSLDTDNSTNTLSKSLSNEKNTKFVKSLVDPVTNLKVPLNLKDGYHLLNIRLVNKEAIVYEKKIPVFIISDLYSIRSVQMYPANVAPGSMALISVQVLAPLNTNPVVGVMQGKTLVSSGAVKDGRFQFFWRAPEKEGFYPLKINLYPDTINTSAMATFPSPENQLLQATVGSAQKTSIDPFLYPENFYSLFILQGAFEDSGYAGDSENNVLELVGVEDVRIAGSGYGYALGNKNALTSENFLLPNASATLLPFSLLIKMTALQNVDGTFNSGSVFQTQNANGFALSVYVNEESYLALTISFPDGTSIDQVSSIKIDSNQHTYSLSFIPESEKLLLQWASDDTVYPFTVHDMPKFALLNSGKSIVGSLKALSFSAVYDDIGIYSEASNDTTRAFTSSFSVFSKLKYSSRLKFAEGFDSLSVDSPYSAFGTQELGRLTLKGKEKLSLDVFTLPVNGITVDFKGSADLSFKLEKGKTLFTVNRNGSFYDADKKLLITIPVLNNAQKFSITVKDGKLYALIGEKKIVCASIDLENIKVSLTLENFVTNDTKIQAYIDSLLLYENEAIDAALLLKSSKSALALIK